MTGTSDSRGGIIIARELALPPATDDATGCVHCGQPLGEDGMPVPAGAAHTWLHIACHAPWLAGRRRKTAEALQAMGIEAAGVTDGRTSLAMKMLVLSTA